MSASLVFLRMSAVSAIESVSVTAGRITVTPENVDVSGTGMVGAPI